MSQLFIRRVGCFQETELPCGEWKFDKAFSAVCSVFTQLT